MLSPDIGPSARFLTTLGAENRAARWYFRLRLKKAAMIHPTSSRPLPWKAGLLALGATSLLLSACSKRDGHSPVDKSMQQSGVYGGRNSGPDASNTGGADGAGGAPVGTSAPNSAGAGDNGSANKGGAI